MGTERRFFSRSDLLLTEILLAVLFFSLSAAVCLQLFAATHRMSRESSLLQLSAVQTTSAAEVLTHWVCEDEEQALLAAPEFFAAAERTGDGLRLYYDPWGGVASAQEADLCLTLHAAADGALTRWTVTAADAKSPDAPPLCRLQVAVYGQRGGGHE